MNKVSKLILFLAMLASPVFAERVNVLVTPLQSVTATGGLDDLNVSPYSRNGSFNLLVANKAGTNPTLTVKLQQSGLSTVGQYYTTAGTTLNKLNEGSTTKVKLGAKFTQSGAKSIKYADLFLEKAGTITAGKKLTLTINTDSSGTPSATVSGTANTVDIDTEVTTGFTWVRFTFPKAVDLADATVYHLVLTTDYTASSSNDVIWRSNTVGSAGNQSTHNATAWSAVTTESQEFILKELTFADVTGGGFTQVTTTASHQQLHFNLEGVVSGHVRTYATIGGTSSPEFFVACLVNAEPRVRP